MLVESNFFCRGSASILDYGLDVAMYNARVVRVGIIGYHIASSKRGAGGYNIKKLRSSISEERSSSEAHKPWQAIGSQVGYSPVVMS